MKFTIEETETLAELRTVELSHLREEMDGGCQVLMSDFS